MEYPPTAEQQAVIDGALSGDNLVVQAGAGTGKTSTLVMVAEQLPKRSLYVAYNKPIQLDASGKFPGHVTCKTSHGLAYGAVGKDFRHRISGKREPSWEVAKRMGLRNLRLGRDVMVKSSHLARIAGDTVRRFCYSADDEITARHVPPQNGIIGADHAVLVANVLPLAQRWWADVNDRSGWMPFEHDHYLKMWALTRPELPYYTIYFDEAQDANPVLAKLISDQNAQQIIVGDSCQQMYAWRGAVDALGGWKNARQLYLAQSWRFGQAIADEANKWLHQLHTPLELIGNPHMDSVVDTLEKPKAILCRTNAGAMGHVLGELDSGRRVSLVGGGDALSRLARAAGDLREGKTTNHPELYAFPDWDSVVRYATEEEGGRDLLPLIKLIEEHGIERILEATNALSRNEDDADVIVSTAHKSKGRQWETVKVAEDFFAPRVTEDGETPTISEAEAMIGYVAVTRAKEVLDCAAVSWIDDLVDTAGPEEDEGGMVLSW